MVTTLPQYKGFESSRKPILAATSSFRCGIDIEGVNVVLNYDMPEDTNTYLQQVACVGGFDAKGLVITLVTDKNDEAILNEIQNRFEIQITEMPDKVDASTYSNEDFF